MREALLTTAILTVISTTGWTQTGLTYRFRADTLVGRVWVADDAARREIDSGEGGFATGRVEIWRDGGRQIFILNPQDRTYYEENAFLARQGLARVTVEPLTVRFPFSVDAVRNLQLHVNERLDTDAVSGSRCRRIVLTFSYTLALRLAKSPISLPGRVEGFQDFCLVDAPQALRLPFGHGLEFTSGHAQVDAAVAERLAGLKGLPVARMLKVTRTIENGEPVSATAVLLVTDVKEEVVPENRFEVPKDYRFREPTIAPPVRRHP